MQTVHSNIVFPKRSQISLDYFSFTLFPSSSIPTLFIQFNISLKFDTSTSFLLNFFSFFFKQTNSLNNLPNTRQHFTATSLYSNPVAQLVRAYCNEINTNIYLIYVLYQCSYCQLSCSFHCFSHVTIM